MVVEDYCTEILWTMNPCDLLSQFNRFGFSRLHCSKPAIMTKWKVHNKWNNSRWSNRSSTMRRTIFPFPTAADPNIRWCRRRGQPNGSGRRESSAILPNSAPSWLRRTAAVRAKEPTHAATRRVEPVPVVAGSSAAGRRRRPEARGNLKAYFDLLLQVQAVVVSKA
jgi:hypothetical protein